MKYFLMIALMFTTLLYSDLSISSSKVQKYCEIIRSSEMTEEWIRWGIMLREKQTDFLALNPSSEDIKKYHKSLEKNLNKFFDQELETAIKADEIMNKESRYNPFPQSSIDKVNILIWVVYEILIKGEMSVTRNKLAVYYHCMDIVKSMK